MAIFIGTLGVCIQPNRLDDYIIDMGESIIHGGVILNNSYKYIFSLIHNLLIYLLNIFGEEINQINTQFIYIYIYITIFINYIILSFCLFIYLFIVFVLYCYVHLRGVATPMISANKPYHIYIYIYIYIIIIIIIIIIIYINIFIRIHDNTSNTSSPNYHNTYFKIYLK